MKKLSPFASIIALFIISTSILANQNTMPSNNNSNAARENMNSDDSLIVVNVVASIEVKEGHLAEFKQILLTMSQMFLLKKVVLNILLLLMSQQILEFKKLIKM